MGQDARIVCRFDSSLAKHADVAAGMGAALMPCGFACLEPRLRQMGPPIPQLSWDLWVLVHPDLRRNARVRAFVDHVVDYFSTRSDRFGVAS